MLCGCDYVSNSCLCCGS